MPKESPNGRVLSLLLRDCVAIPFLSLRATGGGVAISVLSIRCQIASVVSLPRNDLVTPSP